MHKNNYMSIIKGTIEKKGFKFLFLWERHLRSKNIDLDILSVFSFSRYRSWRLPTTRSLEHLSWAEAIHCEKENFLKKILKHHQHHPKDPISTFSTNHQKNVWKNKLAKQHCQVFSKQWVVPLMLRATWFLHRKSLICRLTPEKISSLSILNKSIFPETTFSPELRIRPKPSIFNQRQLQQIFKETLAQYFRNFLAMITTFSSTMRLALN